MGQAAEGDPMKLRAWFACVVVLSACGGSDHGDAAAGSGGSGAAASAGKGAAGRSSGGAGTANAGRAAGGAGQGAGAPGGGAGNGAGGVGSSMGEIRLTPNVVAGQKLGQNTAGIGSQQSALRVGSASAT